MKPSRSRTENDLAVHAEIKKARSLPARAFTDPLFLETELQTLFRRSWLLLPPRPGAEARQDGRERSDLLKLRGARLPVTLLGRPLFLQRGWKDGALRCLPNVCTHAWYPLVSGPGRSQALVCGQHGRRFDCSGRFLSQPGFSGPASAPSDHLRVFPVGSWGPLLFACLGKPARPLERALEALSASTALLGLDRLKRRILDEEEREVEGNWKQHAWNYMDTFHISFIHKAPGGLADAIDLSSYRTELHGASALQWAFAKDPSAGFDPSLLPPRFADPSRTGRRVFALWWFLFPNTALNFYPWGLSVNVYQPVPERPDRTLFGWYAYVLDEAKFRRREELWLSRQVDEEDVEAMSQVRRGASSGLAPRGRFAPEQEAGAHWFHRQVSLAVRAPVC